MPLRLRCRVPHCALLGLTFTAAAAISAEPFPDDHAIAERLRLMEGAPFVWPSNDATRHREAFDRLIEATRPPSPPADSRPFQVLVFVSLTMPTASLDRLARDAATIGAPVLLRGFKEGSLTRTRDALAPLIAASAPASGFQVHPIAFTTYRVTAVPTVVVADGTNRDHPPRFAAVSGDVTLAYALEQLGRGNDELSAHARLQATMLMQRPQGQRDEAAR